MKPMINLQCIPTHHPSPARRSSPMPWTSLQAQQFFICEAPFKRKNLIQFATSHGFPHSAFIWNSVHPFIILPLFGIHCPASTDIIHYLLLPQCKIMETVCRGIINAPLIHTKAHMEKRQLHDNLCICVISWGILPRRSGDYLFFREFSF